MNPSAQAEIRAAHRELNKSAGDNLTTMWQLGKRVEALRQANMQQPVENDAEEVNPVKVMAVVTGLTMGYLERLSRFFRRFPRKDDIESLTAKTMRQSGRRLTWGHIEALLSVEDGAVFDSLIQKVLEDDLNPGALKHLIAGQAEEQQRPRPASPGRPAGRPIGVPIGFDNRISRLMSQVEQFCKNSDSVYLAEEHSFTTAVKSLDRKTLLLKAPMIGISINKSRELVEAMTERAAAILRQFEEVEDYLQDACRERELQMADEDVAAIVAADRKPRRR